MNSSVAIREAQSGLADFLVQVEEALAQTLKDGAGEAHGSGILMEAGRHLCLGSGGKRARPMLVRLFGEALGVPEEVLLKMGIAAELIHSSSLLHDDVVDAGMFRRSRPTVNARYGNVVAVLSGDMLLSTALNNLRGMDAEILHDAVATVRDMTRAAIVEVESRGDLSIPLERMRFVHEGKTGALFGWCGVAPARVARDGEAVARFNTFGRRLGVAFQIADDIRDLTGMDPGKPQFADIQAKNVSMPILIAAQRDESLRRKLRDAWAFTAMTPERVKELGEAVIASGALEVALDKMNSEIQAAIDALGSYGRRSGGDELVKWAHKLAASVQPGRAP